MSLFFGLIFTLATALIVISGDVVIKTAADSARLISLYMAVGIVLYGVSAICWYFAMRHVSLGQGAVAYSMLTLIALFVIGAFWFDETIGTRQLAGMVCALAAMALMSETA
ncbi:MAG: hypothetical protein OXQ92_15290 [Boseongicola sp.]|nr:hypothetical protein [Boseongicola sp.]MDD9977621.1 hypothetical protein [Boseongicola sp.]